MLVERRIENAHLPHYEDDVAPWWQDLAGPGISQAWRDLQCPPGDLPRWLRAHHE